MSKQEILSTRYGEMLDYISCLFIYDGRAEEKVKPVKMNYDEIILLR